MNHCIAVLAFAGLAVAAEPTGSAGEGSAPAPPKPSEEAGVDWALFSDRGRAFRPLIADQREAQVRMGFLQDTGDERSFLDLALGGDLGILHLADGNRWGASLTARGLVASRFEFFSDSFDLQDVDFIGGPALGFRSGPNSLEVFPFHQSSHLGDDLVGEGVTPIDFSHEAVRLLAARELPLGLRAYGGIGVKVRADPGELEGKVTPQAGIEGRWDVLGVPSFAAVDLQTREEADWRMNVTVQVGVELGNPVAVLKRQRLFLEFFDGASNMGQFWDDRQTTVTAGIGFNF